MELLNNRLEICMSPQTILLTELSTAAKAGASVRNAEMVRKIADLFIANEAKYSEEQIELFDDVLSELTREIEISARAELARRLCASRSAPRKLFRKLALDDAIQVAAPLLAYSEHLGDDLLVECAHAKSQDHLFAISSRQSISEAVTDELVGRGEPRVLQRVAENTGARFSDDGYATLIDRAEGDDRLASSIGTRSDLPRHQFLRLLSIASGAVRQKLQAEDPQNAGEIQSVVTLVSQQIAVETSRQSRSYGEAFRQVHALKVAGKLRDLQIIQFCNDKKFEYVAASFALLTNLDIAVIERAFEQERYDTLLTLARAGGLGWPTVKAVLKLRGGRDLMELKDLDHALAKFERIKPDTAERFVALQRRPRANGSR
jgi:uncharacterized protein (DUF2336 family)